MKLLAIDTSSNACSVALGKGNEILERHQVAPRRHTQLVLPMIDELLAESGMVLTELDALVLGRGPGSFTGLRIAAGVVQGLAFSIDRPVILISTLAILAQPWLNKGYTNLVAALDARMGELYWGTFQSDNQGLAISTSPEVLVAPAQAGLPFSGCWAGVGPGFAAYGDDLPSFPGLEVVDDAVLPQARYALALGCRDFQAGLAVPAESALPVYLRDRVVQAPVKPEKMQ